MSKKLYVSNIPFTVTDKDLEDLFGSCGNVIDTKIITDRDTGRSRGFGFVTMESEDDAENAIVNINGREVNGRSLTVSEAKERESSSSSPRKPYAKKLSNGTCILCGEEDTPLYGYTEDVGVCASCISSLSKASRPPRQNSYSGNTGNYNKRY